MKTFPRLFKKTNTGAIQMWQIVVSDSTMTTTHGQVDGKLQTTSDTITEGKNVGRSNETTPNQQAEAEAEAKWNKKVEREGYVEDIERAQDGETDQEGGIPPMLAKTYEDVVKKWTWPCDAQRKFNGNRLVAVIEDGEVSLWSRKRTRISGVPHIQAELEKAFAEIKGSLVLDGECYALGWSLQKISGFFRKQGAKPGHEELGYFVYDTESDLKWEDRRKTLDVAFNFGPLRNLKNIHPVETVRVNSESEAKQLQSAWVQEGYEGAILRRLDTPYQAGKRSAGLVKLKSFKDAEFVIKAVSEGRGKFAGKAMFSLETEKGLPFDCCAPGTMEDRAAFFKEGDKLIGKLLTVKYFELSDDGVPVFPVGLAVRDYNG